MHQTGIQLLNLMFREEENVCVSPNKFGYHSVPFSEAVGDSVVLVPKAESAEKRGKTVEEATEHVSTEKLLLCALNPILGFREDRHCTAFRSFLVELDDGDLANQKKYIDKLGMPYSACIFSGGKSLHFLISLDEDLPDEKAYRMLSRWILNVVTLADQKTLNPSRSIRIPGPERSPGKFQTLVSLKGKVKKDDLMSWLNRFVAAQPEAPKKRIKATESGLDKVKPWALRALREGIDPTKGRNQQWFSLAIEFALAGFEEDEIVSILGQYFQEEHDFKQREWLGAIKSGFKSVEEGKIG